MKLRSNIVATCLLATLFLPLAAVSGTSQATIAFRGTSTLHDFEGVVVSQPFSMESGPDAQRINATIVVHVADMSTNHAKRDRNMFRMLEEENHKLITGKLVDVDLPASGPIQSTIELTIRDTTRLVDATIEPLTTENGRSLKFAFTVSLNEYGLDAPSVLGIIRVGDAVQIEGSFPLPD